MINDLRTDALAIWQAGVNAVDAERLVRNTLRVERRTLHIGDQQIILDDVRRIIVVGTGKAGVGMVAGLEAALGEALLREFDVIGWVNVPADTIPSELESAARRVRLHAARPGSINEPTEAGVQGTREILRLLKAAEPADLCLCLISGGGSALLPAPADGISLEDKLAVTRLLSAAGANIQQLNTVRISLSAVKGGRLAKACQAGALHTLIISDVLGDPLELIASGPTVASSINSTDALRVLQSLSLQEDECGALRRIQEFLQSPEIADDTSAAQDQTNVHNHIVGNLAVAVDAAGLEAERRGYEFAMHVARKLEGEANELGRKLAQLAVTMRIDSTAPNCLIHGGEPVVKLAANHGLGGRNQQLVLAAYAELRSALSGDGSAFDDIIILSAGTDGEDGPTDAAGAFIDGKVHRAALRQQLDPQEFLERNDAYRFFQAAGGLLKTGPTGTNVCDLRVILARSSN